MRSVSENVMAKNLSTIDKAINKSSSWGERYQPTKASITLDELQKLRVRYKDAIDKENIADSLQNKVTSERKAIYDIEYTSKVAKISDSIKLNPLDADAIDRFSNIKKEIQGKRLTVSKVDETKQISTSHLSYDNRALMFSSMVAFLEVNRYREGSTDVSIENLKVFSSILENANVLVDKTKSDYSQIHNKRVVIQEEVYHVISDFKTTVKIIFGKDSYEYSEVKDLSIII